MFFLSIVYYFSCCPQSLIIFLAHCLPYCFCIFPKLLSDTVFFMIIKYEKPLHVFLITLSQSMVENSVGSAPSSPISSRRFASLSAHSAPGSRGGSALGFSDSLSVPPNCMSRSVDAHATPPATLDRRCVLCLVCEVVLSYRLRQLRIDLAQPSG